MGNYKYYTNHIIGILNFIVLIAFFFGTLFSFEDSRLQNCAMVHKERRADSYISEVDTDDNENDMDTTDSLIYKTFYVSKTYLIIFGSYNPQHHNGVDTLSVRAR